VDRELEVIKGEMDATRESLTTKLGKLEDQVRETVSSAGESVTETIVEVKEAVASTVDGVKDAVSTVSESVSSTVGGVKEAVSSATESVKEAFNLSRQVEEHPWAMVGAAVAVGCLGGFLIGGPSKRSASGESFSNWTPSQTPTASAATPASPSASSLSWTASSTREEPKSNEPGLFDSLFSAVKSNAPSVIAPMVTGLEGLAVGSLASVARDLINQAAPETWREGLADMVNDVAQQLTGKRLEDLPSFAASQDMASERNGGSYDDSSAGDRSPASGSRASAQL
jgi:ElaB/YqjD/DUF883 family membrane-anchored ribosome-binding protein